jgi:membrane-associated protein
MKLIGWIIGRDLPPLDVLLAQLVAGMGPWFYLAMFAVIFCETGLVVTPFLPGDSLLFALGALASAQDGPSMAVILGLLSVAAVLGDAVNYAIGYRVGPKVFTSEKSRLFNKAHLLRAQAFYAKYGNKTIILARFVPIVRTFAPFVAGIGKMDYRRFFIYNVIGGLAWVMLCTWSGFFFGKMPWVQQNFEAVAVMIVLISVLPMAVELFLARRRQEPPPAASLPQEQPAPPPALAAHDRVAL